MYPAQDDLQRLRSQLSRFASLPEEDWTLLLPHLRETRLKKQEFFVREGNLARDVALVLDGELRQFYTRDGEERTTYFYFEDHLVCGYISCITQQPSSLSIQALTGCRLIQFPYAQLEELYRKSHSWERLGRRIAEYLALGLEERMVDLLTLNPEQRYQKLLNSGKQKILARIPQQYIANYLGITAVSLSRIRGRPGR